MIYLCVFLVLLLGVVSFYCIKFALIILNVQESIETTLEIIDERYSSITNICERPLFYDSPEVKQVVEDIKVTRDALHEVAFSLSSNFDSNEVIEIDERPEEN